MQIVDLATTYMFIKRLVTPFTKWDAYKLGIIDDGGRVLIPRKEFTKQEQRNAFGYLDLLASNLKRILAHLPGGKTVLASYAAALLLLKEYPKVQKEDQDLIDNLDVIFEEYLAEAQLLMEDAPVNSVGTENIAGAVGEPPVNNKTKYKRANETDTKKLAAQLVVMLKRGNT